MGIKDKLVLLHDQSQPIGYYDPFMDAVRILRCDHCRFYDPPVFGHPGFCHNPELHFDRPEGCPPDFFCSLFGEK